MRRECVLCIQCFIYVLIYIIFVNIKRNVIAPTGMNKVLLYCVTIITSFMCLYQMNQHGLSINVASIII